MAAQISLSIAAISIVLISGSGYVLDRTLSKALRQENELMMLANLTFIRDDLAASGFDVERLAPRLVFRTERRVQLLHAAILDEQRHVIASSPHFPVPVQALPQQALASEDVPAELTTPEIEDLRNRFGRLTTIWMAPDERPYRVLLGRIRVPARGDVSAGSILVALAIEPTETLDVRARDRHNMLAALAIAAVLAVLVGVWIARSIVLSAKRLGAAASRISVQALQERLSLEGTPTELVASTVAFNRMLDRLQGAFERLSAFSSDLAHDLRTPIGNLLGEAQVALSRPRSADEYRQVLESAVEEYERLSRMISNMLFLARADNDQTSLAVTWVEVGAALDRVIAYFEQIAEERGVRLEATVAAEPGVHERVWADELMLIRALSNLVSNAVRYAPRGTRVDLSAAVDSVSGCVIEVSNEGPAIAPEHQARIFDRFFRIDASREGSASGSGLGLAIVRSIMELHHGSARVRSGGGERTVFRLEFPLPQVAMRSGQ